MLMKFTPAHLWATIPVAYGIRVCQNKVVFSLLTDTRKIVAINIIFSRRLLYI